jgi:hypothetical protein
MRSTVVVDEPDEWDAWFSSNSKTEDTTTT